MTELEILKGMRALLADPAKWCQGSLRKFDVSTEGFSYCMLGAAEFVGVDSWVLPTLEGVVRHRGYPSIGRYNDETDHARVLSAIDEAIAILEAKQPSTCAAVKKLIDDAVRAVEAAEA